MRLVSAVVFLCAASPALAGIDVAIDDHILPGYAAFAARTDSLAQAARGDCTAPALRPAFQSAFDAWMGVSHIHIGPVEQDGRALAIAFWPDSRGLTERSLRDLIAQRDPVVEDPGGFQDVSVATRGFFALERLLYDDAFSDYPMGSYACDLAKAVADDLARMGGEVLAEWRGGYADTLATAGSDGNTVFLSEREASQALFTALVTGLAFNAEQRLGLPLGTFDRPRPLRAEAWRSGRSLRNVILSLEALRNLAATLTDAAPVDKLAAFDAALSAARALDDPVFAGVATPQGRLDVEILQQRIAAIQQTAAVEIGQRLGVAAGFNAADGD